MTLVITTTHHRLRRITLWNVVCFKYDENGFKAFQSDRPNTEIPVDIKIEKIDIKH